MTKLTTVENLKIETAAERLKAQARAYVAPRAMQEDSAFTEEVHVHDGPAGKQGRTIILSQQTGNILSRRMIADGALGRSEDWSDIDLSKLVTQPKRKVA